MIYLSCISISLPNILLLLHYILTQLPIGNDHATRGRNRSGVHGQGRQLYRLHVGGWNESERTSGSGGLCIYAFHSRKVRVFLSYEVLE